MCLLLLASLIRLFPLPCGLEEVWGRRMTHFAKILELVLNRKHLDCGEMQWVGVCGCVRERERGRGRSPAKDINPIPISWSLNTAGKTWGHAVLAQINPRHIKKKKKDAHTFIGKYMYPDREKKINSISTKCALQSWLSTGMISCCCTGPQNGWNKNKISNSSFYMSSRAFGLVVFGLLRGLWVVSLGERHFRFSKISHLCLSSAD